MNEIGSDFWDVETTNTEYFLSGRTGEEYIIRDILETQHIESALLPSFCCQSMIEPFVRHNIPIRFYDVVFDEELHAVLPDKKDKEILLYLDYFGYRRIKGLERIFDWDITIEDCTHSWMRKQSSDADYSFISYRKWTGFTAIARANKKSGAFIAGHCSCQNEHYEKLREMAISLKKDYIENGVGEKETYLNQFKFSEEILDTDYADYSPSADSLTQILSLDVEKIKKKRKLNAKILYEGLSEIEGLSFMFSSLLEDDVLLNVPVLVEPGVRGKLRRYLIENNIYCPIHWPVTELHKISDEEKEIYDKELSLICDQRYDEADMEREVQVIQDFFRRHR